MFHYGVRKGMDPFVRYLMWTMAAGGTLGISHGISTTINRKEMRTASIMHDGMAGAIAGPWAPIFIPLVLTGVWPSKCPYYKKPTP